MIAEKKERFLQSLEILYAVFCGLGFPSRSEK
jgi:hypothetical protein